MRLDLFLRTSRLFLRRSLAQKACDDGRVFLNGRPAKAAREVTMGDTISIARESGTISVVVAELPTRKQVSKADSRQLYEVVANDQTLLS